MTSKKSIFKSLLVLTAMLSLVSCGHMRRNCCKKSCDSSKEQCDRKEKDCHGKESEQCDRKNDADKKVEEKK